MMLRLAMMKGSDLRSASNLQFAVRLHHQYFSLPTCQLWNFPWALDVQHIAKKWRSLWRNRALQFSSSVSTPIFFSPWGAEQTVGEHLFNAPWRSRRCTTNVWLTTSDQPLRPSLLEVTWISPRRRENRFYRESHKGHDSRDLSWLIVNLFFLMVSQ